MSTLLKKFSIRKWVKPLAQRTIGAITHFTTQEAVAALTFDDGPHPEYTPPLLDILEKYGARGTFFVLGQSAHRYPSIVKAVAERGHAIGNHSWDHPSFPLISRSARRQQIRQCQKAISPYGQHLFRPPFGHRSRSSMLDVKLMGYETVAWNVGGTDCMGHNGVWIADSVIPKVTPGCIILLHDALHNFFDETYINRAPILEAVELLLQQLGTKMQFITLPEMFRVGKPQRSIKAPKVDLNWLGGLKTVG